MQKNVNQPVSLLDQKLKSQAHLLKQDFKESQRWDQLREKHKLSKPPEYYPCTLLKYARRALEAIGKDESDFEQAQGMKLKHFPNHRPDWPAWALQGLILEMGES